MDCRVRPGNDELRLMAQEFSPTEIFKRATAATWRAIAERDDVTVGFGPEPAGQSGARVRLPNPRAAGACRLGPEADGHIVTFGDRTQGGRGGAFEHLDRGKVLGHQLYRPATTSASR